MVAAWRCAFLLLAGACEVIPPAPTLSSVVPEEVPFGQRTQVAVHGSAFFARVGGDLPHPQDATIVGTFSLRLLGVGAEPIPMPLARHAGSDRLEAWVEATTPADLYDLMLVDPWGRQALLPAALRVLEPDCRDDVDRDGHVAAACGGDDCDDGCSVCWQGAEEWWDDLDNDCDGAVDECIVDCACGADLVACYPFDGDVNDHGGAVPLDGTVSTATYSPAVLGDGIVFDTATRVQVGHSAALDFTEAVSIEMWLRPNAWPASRPVGILDNDGQWGVFLQPGGELRCTVSGFELAGAGQAELATWTHFACVYDGYALESFQDGLRVASIAASGPIDTGNTTPMVIGGSAGGDRFQGMLDSLRIFRSVRTPQQICALAGACAGP